jgi:hypothetical protein
LRASGQDKYRPLAPTIRQGGHLLDYIVDFLWVNSFAPAIRGLGQHHLRASKDRRGKQAQG